MSTPNSPSSSSTRPVLTRASKGKSRAGCITCKKRKVKCDEVHPSCTNCCRRSHPCLYKVSEAPRWKQGLATLVLPSLQPSRATRSDESANIVTKSDESKGKSDEDVVSLKQSEAALPRSLSCISSGFGQSFGIEDYYLLTKFDSLSSMEMLNYYELDVNKIIQLSFHVRSTIYCLVSQITSLTTLRMTFYFTACSRSSHGISTVDSTNDPAAKHPRHPTTSSTSNSIISSTHSQSTTQRSTPVHRVTNTPSWQPPSFSPSTAVPSPTFHLSTVR